ncbi:hypothetical protein [Streptomyces flavofungini]|uniref:hypothetical protein n=1 Tax=Streptomyces flavofungini TaxID=68200 RepID=UPI0034DF81DB
MHIITHAQDAGTTRPGLPSRPIPHERDGRQPAPEPAARPHPQQQDRVAALHQLVRHLTADGDTRAAQAGRRARRTLAEMAVAS